MPIRPSPWRAAVLLSLSAALASGEEPAEEKPESSPVQITRRNGRTTLEFASGSVSLENRLQLRFTQESPDAKHTLVGTSGPGEGRGSFRLRRAKTTLEGWFIRKELTYEVQVGWTGADSGPAGTFSGLEDAYVRWDASGDGRFTVTGGQFKVPFGRQELTSSERLQFVDRSILSFEFTKGRDVGVAVGGKAAGGRFEYAAGIFNGNQRNRPVNDNDRYQYDARVVVEPWGNVKSGEADLDATERPAVALGLSFERNDLAGATNATDFATTILAADAVFKYRGVSLFAEYFGRERSPETGTSFRSDGYHLQAGAFVIRKRLEIVVRYASWDPTDAVSGNDRGEIGGGANVYLEGHNVKLQADYRQLEDKADDTKDRELRLQTQFVF